MPRQAKHQQSECCYRNWVAQQGLDLDELHQALTHHPTDPDYLRLLTTKTISHFQDYINTRAELARHDGSSFLAPTWGTTFENSFMWIGGCRPTLIIRLVYALCGSQLNAHLAEFLEGVRHGNLGEISGSQLTRIDALHAKTIKEENKLTSRMATLQEGIADEPLAILAKDSREMGESSHAEMVNKAMDSHALALSTVLIEADKLRANTLKGMIDILTPLQAVELLVASNKLHLSLHEWSKRRDLEMGITQVLNINNPSSSTGPPSDPHVGFSGQP